MLRSELESQRDAVDLGAFRDRYAALFEHSQDAIVFTRPDGSILDANDAALAMFGVHRSILPRFRVEDAYVNPEDRSRLLEAVCRRGAVREVEVRFRRASGEEFHGTFSGTLCRSGTAVVGIIGVIRDVTQARETEERLRRSEERLKGILETSTGGLVIVGRDGRIEYANPAAEQILGLVQTGDASEGRRYDDPRWKITDIDGGPFPEDQLPFVRVMASGRAVNGVVHAIEWPDGTRVVLSINGAPLTDQHGAVVGMVASMHDITERTRIERELRARERELNMVLEHSPDVIARVDRHLRYVYVNRAMEHYIGLPASRMIGRTNRQLDMPADICDVWEIAQRAVLATGRPRFLDCDLPSGDEVARFEAHLIPEFDERGEVVSIVSFARDVTALRAAQDALERSEAKFRGILETAAEVLMLLDDQGTVRYVSPAVKRYGGAVPELIDGRPMGHLVHPEDRPRVEGVVRHVLGTPGLTENIAPYRVRVPDGSVLWCEARVTNLLDHPAIRAVVVHARDVTARVEAEAARNRAEEQFRQAQKMEAIGRLAGGVAHDFNNLLTAITGSAELALEDAREEELRGDLETIRNAAYKAAAITRQLLAFSRKQMTSPQVINVNDAVQGFEPLVRRLVGPDVSVELSLEAHSAIHIDPVQLEQALLNLVVNANDAMSRVGHLTIRTATSPDGGHVVVEVVDTGIGIEETIRSRIFEPFFTTKAPGHGTGLGLATVYGIVEQAGGRIEVDSAPGRGSTFRLLLPAVADTPHATGEHRVAADSLRGTETILVVDDEASVRLPVAKSLRRKGYTVIEAKHGKDALTLLAERRSPVDLVITDLVMPEMGGAELIGELRASAPSMPVIFVSGYSRDVAKARGAAQDAPFLQKPFKMDVLARVVRETLDRSSPLTRVA